MARVTIADSLKNCKNIYDLIFKSAARARQLQHGARPLVDKKGSVTVTALREIAAGFTEDDFKTTLKAEEYY